MQCATLLVNESELSAESKQILRSHMKESPLRSAVLRTSPLTTEERSQCLTALADGQRRLRNPEARDAPLLLKVSSSNCVSCGQLFDMSNTCHCDQSILCCGREIRCCPVHAGGMRKDDVKLTHIGRYDKVTKQVHWYQSRAAAY